VVEFIRVARSARGRRCGIDGPLQECAKNATGLKAKLGYSHGFKLGRITLVKKPATLPLEYSSPAREGQQEVERREALENYNESTFGERRPVAGAFVRFAIFAAILVPLAFLLPRGPFYLVSIPLSLAFAFWEKLGNR